MAKSSGSWKPGQSGNPAGGRPNRAKQKLNDVFIRAMARAFEEEGEKAIQRVIEQDPAKFLDVIVKLLPRDSTLSVEDGPLVVKIIRHSDAEDAEGN